MVLDVYSEMILSMFRGIPKSEFLEHSISKFKGDNQKFNKTLIPLGSANIVEIFCMFDVLRKYFEIEQ